MFMDAEALILAVLGAVPAHEVGGRKRLQKLAFFAIQAGADCKVRFSLHDFGPFSTEIANATEMLTFFGAISEREEQLPKTKRFFKVYGLDDPLTVPERLSDIASDTLRVLDKYSTIELEIASTIRYFMNNGDAAASAIEATRKLKPTKSAPKIVQRAEEALSKVGLYERGRADQVSRSRSY